MDSGPDSVSLKGQRYLVCGNPRARVTVNEIKCVQPCSLWPHPVQRAKQHEPPVGLHQEGSHRCPRGPDTEGGSCSSKGTPDAQCGHACSVFPDRLRTPSVLASVNSLLCYENHK